MQGTHSVGLTQADAHSLYWYSQNDFLQNECADCPHRAPSHYQVKFTSLSSVHCLQESAATHRCRHPHLTKASQDHPCRRIYFCIHYLVSGTHSEPIQGTQLFQWAPAGSYSELLCSHDHNYFTAHLTGARCVHLKHHVRLPRPLSDYFIEKPQQFESIQTLPPNALDLHPATLSPLPPPFSPLQPHHPSTACISARLACAFATAMICFADALRLSYLFDRINYFY